MQLFDLVKYILIAYPIAWGVTKGIQTDMHLLNIILSTAIFMPAYCLVLYLIRDAIALKYFKKIRNKFKH
jgi:uncharacterized membrane protein YqaE (UPF0057 family)